MTVKKLVVKIVTVKVTMMMLMVKMLTVMGANGWISRQSGSMLGQRLTVSGARPLVGHHHHLFCHHICFHSKSPNLALCKDKLGEAGLPKKIFFSVSIFWTIP